MHCVSAAGLAQSVTSIAKAHCIAIAAAACTVLSGCSYLPHSGPTHYSIHGRASETIRTRDRVAMDYVLVDISEKVLNSVRYTSHTSLHKSFGAGKGPSPEIKIGVGDTLQISIYESSPGGLFQSGDITTRVSTSATLPLQFVDHNGMITVPYAGQIKAAGRSPLQVQRSIEASLRQRAIEPQVIISLPEQTSADVSIFGNAVGNLRSRIRPGGERILELLARAGVSAPPHEALITLQRGKKRASIQFQSLLERPEENIYLHPGDIIYASRLQQRFSVFGAAANTTQTTGLTGQFVFDSGDVSLTEAVARAGGLLDTRASTRGVYLYRLEQRDVLEEFGADLKRFSDDRDHLPTIYRADFSDPSIFFVANRFPMRHRDVIYIVNADAVELEKFVTHVSTVTGAVANVSTDIVTIRNPSATVGNR